MNTNIIEVTDASWMDWVIQIGTLAVWIGLLVGVGYLLILGIKALSVYIKNNEKK